MAFKISKVDAHYAARTCSIGRWAWLATLLNFNYSFLRGTSFITFSANLVIAIPLALLTAFYLWKGRTTVSIAIVMLYALLSPVSLIAAAALQLSGNGKFAVYANCSKIALSVTFLFLFKRWASLLDISEAKRIPQQFERLFLFGAVPMLAFLGWCIAFAAEDTRLAAIRTGFSVGPISLDALPIWQSTTFAALMIGIGIIAYWCAIFPMIAFAKFRDYWLDYGNRAP